MSTGEIKWFSERIKTGFIKTDEGKNVYFDLQAVQEDDLPAIQEGK